MIIQAGSSSAAVELGPRNQHREYGCSTHHPLDQPVGGERQVIENTVARAAIGQGMKADVSGVCGIPVLRCLLRR
jgi:hypothetical protein